MTTARLKDVLREHPDGCTLAVRMQPGAKKSCFAGFYGEGSETRVKIALQAPPIDGRANEALLALLADIFNLPPSAISIALGQSSRAKVVILRGIHPAQAETRLEASFGSL